MESEFVEVEAQAAILIADENIDAVEAEVKILEDGREGATHGLDYKTEDVAARWPRRMKICRISLPTSRVA
jgi:hypothetical protein